MIKEHENLLRSTNSELNPKYTYFNKEEKYITYYQLMKVNEDGYLQAEDKKYYE